MRVKYIGEKELVQETWKSENKKGQVITIKKGDVFYTEMWGCSESVVTDKGEWICDIDCKEFNELFEVIKMELWQVQFIRQLYFYETTISDFESLDLFEFLKEHTEMGDREEFVKWIAEEELGDNFCEWLDEKGCLPMFADCVQ